LENISAALAAKEAFFGVDEGHNKVWKKSFDLTCLAVKIFFILFQNCYFYANK
jgi:hypothetical protein